MTYVRHRTDGGGAEIYCLRSGSVPLSAEPDSDSLPKRICEAT